MLPGDLVGEDPDRDAQAHLNVIDLAWIEDQHDPVPDGGHVADHAPRPQRQPDRQRPEQAPRPRRQRGGNTEPLRPGGGPPYRPVRDRPGVRGRGRGTHRHVSGRAAEPESRFGRWTPSTRSMASKAFARPQPPPYLVQKELRGRGHPRRRLGHEVDEVARQQRSGSSGPASSGPASSGHSLP